MAFDDLLKELEERRQRVLAMGGPDKLAQLKACSTRENASIVCSIRDLSLNRVSLLSRRGSKTSRALPPMPRSRASAASTGAKWPPCRTISR